MSTLPGQQPGATQAQARGTSTPAATCLCGNLCMVFMHVHVHAFDAGVITYPQIRKYITGDHSLAISGHQGSFLSLKHAWAVCLASQLLSRQGEGTPSVVGVQKLDQGHGALQPG